jgi:hypothetical protein
MGHETAPIGYVLGVEGQFYLAKAMRDEFKRPVVGIATSQRVLEMMTPERKAIFEKIYSLPDFYLEQIDGIRNLSRGELDREQQALEKELGVVYGSLFTFYDRSLRALGDYNKLRHWELCNLRFAKKLMDEITPAFMLDGVTTYLQHVLRAACRQRDIPYLMSESGRVRRDRVALLHENGQQVGMQHIFKALQEGNTRSLEPETLAEADAAFDSFLSAPTQPAYTTLNSVAGFDVERIWRRAKWALRPEHVFPSERVRLIDRAMNLEFSPETIALGALVARCRRTTQKLLNVFDENPDLSVPFIYLPLHHTPEVSDLYFGTLYDHHESFVTQVAKFIPSHMQLYVKDHVSMLGRRPSTFYLNLNRLPNVKMIHPEVNTFSLIRGAEATVTVTGTAGWEAFQLGRPCVALGNVFYNFLPGVLHCPLDMTFPARFTAFLEQFSPSETIRRNGYRACYGTTFRGEKVDLEGTSTRENAAEAACGFARAVRVVIACFGGEMERTFPQDLLRARGECSSVVAKRIAR